MPLGFATPNPYSALLPDEVKKAAAWQGLQALASSLLQSSAPSPVPNPFGAALGRAMNAFQMAQTAAQSNALQATLASEQLKTSQAQRKKLEAEAEADTSWLRFFGPGGTAGGAQAAAMDATLPGAGTSPAGGAALNFVGMPRPAEAPMSDIPAPLMRLAQVMGREKGGALIGSYLAREAKEAPGAATQIVPDPTSETGWRFAGGVAKGQPAPAPEGYRRQEKMFTVNRGDTTVTYIGMENDPATWRKVDQAPRDIRDRGPEGPFGGTSMDAQVRNILLGPKDGPPPDPSTQEYAAAYSYAAQPRTDFDQATGRLVTITPDMSAYRQPTRAAVRPSAQGGVTEPPAAPGRPTVDISQMDAPQKLKAASAEAETIVSTLDNFMAAVRAASPADKAAAAAGVATPGGNRLQTAWSIAALLAKGEELFNLGVLNGPDLDVIRRTVSDPSTFRGLISGEKSYEAQIDEIKKLIRMRLETKRKQWGQASPNGGGNLKSKYGLE